MSPPPRDFRGQRNPHCRCVVHAASLPNQHHRQPQRRLAHPDQSASQARSADPTRQPHRVATIRPTIDHFEASRRKIGHGEISPQGIGRSEANRRETDLAAENPPAAAHPDPNEANRVFDWLLGAPLPVGTPAPEFSASDQDGNLVSLKSLRGRNVILVFYPADDTAVCTKQLCEFRDSWASVSSKNVVLFGVNPAQSGKHDQFRKKYSLPFPLLVDEGQKIAKAYQSSFSFAPRRTVYLIGPDGFIRYAQRGKPAPSEVLAAAA